MPNAPQSRPKPKLFSVSRVILLIILAAALGGLALDQSSKRQMAKLDELLNTLNQQNEEGSGKSLTPQMIREAAQDTLGKQPTQSSPTADIYDFPGVFYTYRLTVNYRNLGKLKGEDEIAYHGHRPVSVYRFGGVVEE